METGQTRNGRQGKPATAGKRFLTIQAPRKQGHASPPWAAVIRGRRAAVIAIVLLLTACRPAGAGPETPLSGEVVREGNLFVVLSPHYRVQSDISPEAAVLVASHMEAVASAYDRLLKPFGGGTPAPAGKPATAGEPERFNVAVYREKRDYLEAAGLANENTVGLYNPSGRILLACARGAGMDAVLGTLRHEGFHQFADRYLGAGIPPWINEGLAEYFRYCRVQVHADPAFGGGAAELIQGEVAPQPLRVVQQALRANRAIPVALLTRLTLEDWNRTREENPLKGSVAYAESWLLVHFLIEAEKGRYQPHLNRCLALISRGPAPERGRDAQQRAFGDSAALQKAWQRYVMQLQASPRYVCRENLEMIGLLLLERGRGKQYTAQEFRAALLGGKLGRWQLGDPNGRLIHSEKDDEIRQLLRCPLDNPVGRAGAGMSYEFRYASQADPLPVVVCRHHEGFALLLRFEYDKLNEKWQAWISEEPLEEP